MATFKQYYKLTKPGIVYANVFTTVAAFLFASPWDWGEFTAVQIVLLFLATVVGIALVVASACVFNNYLDRGIDKKMSRTANRALVTGAISSRSAISYATLLGLIGISLLYIDVNPLTAVIAFIGFVFYVVIYGLAKRGSHWGAVVGSVSGAVPIVVGYTAVTNQLDPIALILFLILVFWQMPHFYAIAMYRLDEYKAAGIPVLPAKKGMRATKVHILWYIVAYLIAVSLLAPFFANGAPRYFYIASVLLFGLRWLAISIQGFGTKVGSGDGKIMTDEKWARKLFFFSLIVLVSFSVTIAIAPLFAYWPAPLHVSSSPNVSGTIATTTADTASATSTSQDIPGNNLTLGEDGNASVGKFLIGYNGMTLYTYAKDTQGVSNCMASCTTTWMPYIVTTNKNLVAEYPVAGKISTINRADGSLQVTYNGQPLYFYSGDHATDETNGIGVSSLWNIARP